jgi:hypothetical protein
MYLRGFRMTSVETAFLLVAVWGMGMSGTHPNVCHRRRQCQCDKAFARRLHVSCEDSNYRQLNLLTPSVIVVRWGIAESPKRGSLGAMF